MMSVPCHALGRGHLDSIADSEIALQLGLCPSNLDQQESTRNQKKKKILKGKKWTVEEQKKKSIFRKTQERGQGYRSVFKREREKV